MKKFLIFITSILFLFPSFSFAQLSASNYGSAMSSLADELTVNLYPNYPKPNENINASLEMYSANIDTANISWYLDGILAQKGKGLKNFSFKAPDAGKSRKLNISVVLQSGTSFTKTLTIKPVGLDILWQADSYTPPFYKGKALFPPQGYIKIYALPDFSASLDSTNPSSNLVYKWTINGEVADYLSGYGKNFATVQGPILGKPMDIDITATDPATSVTAESELTINPTDPHIVFYENSPLYGMVFEKALDTNISLANQEIDILAAPFNMSTDNLNSIQYSWRINGQNQPDIAGRSAIFRKPDNVSGSSNVSLEIKNPSKPLQLTDESFSIQFNSQ